MGRVALLLLAIPLTAALFAPPISATAGEDGDIYKYFKVFVDVFHLTREYYLEDVDTSILADGAVRGMVLRVDPYGCYYTSTLPEPSDDPVLLAGRSLGLILGSRENVPVVIRVFPDSPAAVAGVLPGEKLIAIGEASALGLTFAELAEKLTCPQEGSLALKFVDSEGRRLLDRTLTCVPFTVHTSLTVDDVASGITRIRIPSLAGSQEVAALSSALNELTARKQIKLLIIDVRGSADGAEQFGWQAADLFIADGSAQADIIDAKGNVVKSLAAVDGRSWTGPPVLFLVDQSTAAAAEVLAAAARAGVRANIAGTPTFGKAISQRRVQLKDGGILQISEGTYRIASIEINGKGIEPDVVLSTVSQPGADVADSWLSEAIEAFEQGKFTVSSEPEPGS